MQFSFRQTVLLGSRILQGTALSLTAYVQELVSHLAGREYNSSEAFLRLPFDNHLLDQVNWLVREKSRPNLHAVVVVGIGGANLGTWAVCSALEEQLTRRIFFSEALDALSLKRILEIWEKVYREGGHVELVLVSSSGKTIETLTNYAILRRRLQQDDAFWAKRITVVTASDSPLVEHARKYGHALLVVPSAIADRYAVFSAEGLFPLALAGVNLEQFRAGAQALLKDGFLDPAPLWSAAALYCHYQQGRKVHNTFLFDPSLERIGKWYRQLVAESLGKNHLGITPLVSIGSTDLHSVGQLYLGGANDKVTTFVGVKSSALDYQVPQGDFSLALAQNLVGKSLGEINRAIYQGVRTTYHQQGLPFMEIKFVERNAYELGQFMQMKMIETVLLGKLFKVNPFDQPAVEAYKNVARQILARG